MKTVHTTTAPAGVPSREVKLAKVTTVEEIVPAKAEGEEPQTITKKVVEFTRAFRSRMNSKMIRRARKANTEFLPV